MVTVKTPPKQSKAPNGRRYLRRFVLFLVAAITIYLSVPLRTAKKELTFDHVPDDWWEWTIWGIQDYLECEDIYEAGRPIHSHEDWVSLRNAYRNVVGPEKSSLLPDDNIDGFGNVSIISKISPGRGRGVFAAQDIPKGTRVWTSNHQSAKFHDGDLYRKFLASIPKEMACDVLMWAYVHDLGDDEESDLTISCDLDEGSFINSAGWDDGAIANIGCIDDLDEVYAEENLDPKYLDGGCPENLFALRDIKAGDEIICSYGEFALPKGWQHFGL